MGLPLPDLLSASWADVSGNILYRPTRGESVIPSSPIPLDISPSGQVDCQAKAPRGSRDSLDQSAFYHTSMRIQVQIPVGKGVCGESTGTSDPGEAGTRGPLKVVSQPG